MGKPNKSKDARLASAAKKLSELDDHWLDAREAFLPSYELPIFKWLQMDVPDRRILISKYMELISQENQVTMMDIPKAKTKHDFEVERFTQLLAITKMQLSSKEKKTKPLMKKITQSTDFLNNFQRILGKSQPLAVSPRSKIQREVIGVLELKRITDALQVLRQKLHESKDPKMHTKFVAELRESLKKYERMLAHVRESEVALLKDFERMKDMLAKAPNNNDIDSAVWDVVEEPVLRRLAFAKLCVSEASNDRAILVQESTQIPALRDKTQAEIANIATKQYRSLAKLYHSDKGGTESHRFEDITYSHGVITDTDHLIEADQRRPNLLLEYVTKGNHSEFVKWYRSEKARQDQVPRATNHAKKKVNGQYVSDEQAQTRSTKAPPKLMLEGGLPPKCKIPKIDFQKTEAGEVLPRGKAVVKFACSWAPANPSALKFQLQVADSRQTTPKFANKYSGEKDFCQVELSYPGQYSVRVRGGNAQGFGEWSLEASVHLNSNGDLNEPGAKKEVILETPVNKGNLATRELRKAVERAAERVKGTLHARDRPEVIATLKTSLLQNKSNVEDVELKTEARNILIALRRKELTTKWRQELKMWTETVLDDEMEEDEVEVEVFIRIKSLDLERLNWFYQHQLSRTKKIVDMYKGNLDTMPLTQRHMHRCVGHVLAHIITIKQMKPKLFDEFVRMQAELEGALDRSEQLEKQREEEIQAMHKRQDQRNQDEILKRQQEMKEEYIRISERNEQQKKQRKIDEAAAIIREAETKRQEEEQKVKQQEQLRLQQLQAERDKILEAERDKILKAEALRVRRQNLDKEAKLKQQRQQQQQQQHQQQQQQQQQLLQKQMLLKQQQQQQQQQHFAQQHHQQQHQQQQQQQQQQQLQLQPQQQHTSQTTPPLPTTTSDLLLNDKDIYNKLLQQLGANVDATSLEQTQFSHQLSSRGSGSGSGSGSVSGSSSSGSGRGTRGRGRGGRGRGSAPRNNLQPRATSSSVLPSSTIATATATATTTSIPTITSMGVGSQPTLTVGSTLPSSLGFPTATSALHLPNTGDVTSTFGTTSSDVLGPPSFDAYPSFDRTQSTTSLLSSLGGTNHVTPPYQSGALQVGSTPHSPKLPRAVTRPASVSNSPKAARTTSGPGMFAPTIKPPPGIIGKGGSPSIPLPPGLLTETPFLATASEPPGLHPIPHVKPKTTEPPPGLRAPPSPTQATTTTTTTTTANNNTNNTANTTTNNNKPSPTLTSNDPLRDAFNMSSTRTHTLMSQMGMGMDEGVKDSSKFNVNAAPWNATSSTTTTTNSNNVITNNNNNNNNNNTSITATSSGGISTESLVGLTSQTTDGSNSGFDSADMGWGGNGESFHLPSEFTTPSTSDPSYSHDPFGNSDSGVGFTTESKEALPTGEPTGLDPKVRNFLSKINMSKYAAAFVENEVDWDALLMLEKEDLMNLGIDKMGPLLKFKRALEEAQNDGPPVELTQEKSQSDSRKHMGSLWSDFGDVGDRFEPESNTTSASSSFNKW